MAKACSSGRRREELELTEVYCWARHGERMLTCLTAGGGIGADCNGYPANAVRYDSPTLGDFSVSRSYGEDDMWDVAVRYAADWNSMKLRRRRETPR